MLVWIFRMACALSWVWESPTILFLLKRLRKQNFCWTNWWYVWPKLDYNWTWVTPKNIDNTVTNSDCTASSKWTGNWGPRPWLHTEKWFAQRILATTPRISHITLRLRRNRFMHTDLFWSTRIFQCETVFSIVTPWSLLLLVSVLFTSKCTNNRNKICTRWVLRFPGYYVPLLGLLVTWIGMSFFFSSRPFAAIRFQGTVLLVSFQALGLFLYWPVSRCARG